MLKLWIRSGVLALLALLAGCAHQPAQQTASVKGDLFYLQKVGLPPQAEITVQLLDVSKADAAAEILAQHSFTGLQAPLKFILHYDQNRIQPGHTYAVAGRIEVGDQLWFINTSRHDVDLSQGSVDGVKLQLDLVRN